MSDALILVRAVHFVATVTLAGAAIFAAVVAGPASRRTGDDAGGAAFRRRLLRIIWGGFGVALISGAAWLVLLAAKMSARTPAEVLSDGVVWTVLLHTTFGHDWLARLALAALLAAALCRISPKHVGLWRWAIAALLAAALAAALVHSGHAAATAGWIGSLHRAADGLHLIAASAWLGGLVPLALLLRAASRGEVSPAVARAATLRFSTLGLVSVGILVATGIVNGWILVGNAPALIGTGYGRLILGKVALFLVMVAIAGVNRLRLTPQLAGDTAAPNAPAKGDTLSALVRNSLIETALGVAILMIVGVLGETPPGAHVQTIWPLAMRYSDAAFGDPELRARLVPALWTIAGSLLSILLVVIAVTARRSRPWPMPWVTAWLLAAGAAIACVAYVAPTLSLATVEAYPTSFYVSPTRYSASSIVQGADLFATHCASCHGPRGRGDGRAARFFRVKPSDLTVDHVYAHSDGDLYWWITNGIGEVMPPFGAVLGEAGRWNVIDFVRANADAGRLDQAAGKVTPAGYRMPDFAAACPDGSTVSRDALRGRIAHVIIAGPRSAERVAQLAAHRDVVTVAIPLENVAAAAACRADDLELASALALLRGRDAAQSDGSEFLVDAAGTLRAMWSPGGQPDWRDANALQQEIAAIRSGPAAVPTTGTHLHGR